jgi:hypothetical protein
VALATALPFFALKVWFQICAALLKIALFSGCPAVAYESLAADSVNGGQIFILDIIRV